MALKPFETLSQNYRNLQRTQEIINVFIKHGFDDWWGRLKADGRVKALLEKYESQLREPPMGKKYQECFDMATGKPKPEFVALYREARQEMADEFGLQFKHASPYL